MDKRIQVIIDDEQVEVDAENVPVAFNYVLERSEDFRIKSGINTIELVTYITNKNSRLGNTLHHPSVADTSQGDVFENPRKVVVRNAGYELMNGKALLKKATHSNQPQKFIWDLFGDNSEWAIELSDKSLAPFLNERLFTFNHITIYNSWNYTGYSAIDDVVFTPVRYAKPFGEGYDEWQGKDTVVTIYDLRPAISVYWILHRAFASIGFSMKSNFMDSPFFRRLLMPWVWGNFQELSNTVYDEYKCKAATPDAERGSGDCHLWGVSLDRFVNLKVTNDSTDGNFDNAGTPGVYTYNVNRSALTYTYPANATSRVIIAFSATIYNDWTVTAGSYANMRVMWYRNNQLLSEELVVGLDAPAVGRRNDVGQKVVFYEVMVQPGDIIECRFFMSMKDTSAGRANCDQYVTEFKVDYFKFTIDSTYQLKQYNKFNNYKFLDLLRGLTDTFDLQFTTDVKRKVVSIEPFFDYQTALQQPKQSGFIILDPKDWSLKQDLSKESEVEIFSDYEREWIFKHKDDSADGALKKMQDRFQSKIGEAKYAFTERFKPRTKSFENRFFSTLMHVEAQQFASVTGIAPQIPCMFPENISNTSAAESENTFEPKLAYYKGNVAGVGGWRFLNENNEVISYNSLPFLFAVNYKSGGEQDPVLSYADQYINGTVVPGLVRNYLLQRLAVYRHGRRYKTFFKLQNSDVLGAIFRNTIMLKGNQWVLTELQGFKPSSDESTTALLWKWYPITKADDEAVFPSRQSTEGSSLVPNSIDFKYLPHTILYSDLPK